MKAEDAAKYREWMCSKSSMRDIIDHFIARSLDDEQAQDGGDEIPVEYLRQMLQTNYYAANDTIFDHAESEIEKMFLGSLVMGFIKMDPLGLVVQPPAADAPAAIANRREAFVTVRKLRKELDAEGKGRTVRDYCDWLDQQGDMDKEEMDWWRTICTVESALGDAFHVIPQAGVPSLKVGKRGMRVDMLLWVPTKPDINMVVECDGYKWHSSQDSFTSDRQRDRLLSANGYRVIRYSGTEIYHDPVTCAAELVQNLVDIREKWLDEE